MYVADSLAASDTAVDLGIARCMRGSRVRTSMQYGSLQKIADNFLERYNANALSCGEPWLLDDLLKSTPRWESVSSLRRRLAETLAGYLLQP